MGKKTAKTDDKALAKTKNNALAVTNEELSNGFGGPETTAPIELAWPEVKMTKMSDFKFADGTKAQELVGYLIYAQRSRAFWNKEYDGSDSPPDCASSNAIKPDTEEPQSEFCGQNLCEKATWYKDEEGDNKIDCHESLNAFFLLEGKIVPRFMRIRSTSMHKKTPLAAFFTNCAEKGYALDRKFQTVKIKLTLKETKLNGFETSVLQVEKVSVLEQGDPLLRILMKLYSEIEKDFVVVHKAEDDNSFVNEEQGGDTGDAEYNDDTPI